MASTDNVLGDDSINTGFTKFEHAIVGVLYLLFCLVGVTTNFLTALTFYKDTKLLSNSKPWIHICLAVANILVVAPAPFPASSSFSGRWLYGKTLCQMYAFEGMFIGIVAIGAVVALCVERYYITTISKSKPDGSGWFYLWSIILILGNGFFWAVMPLLGWSRYDIEHTGTSCAIDWKNPDEGYVSYIVTLTIFSFVLPMIGAFVCLYSAHPKPTDQSVASTGEPVQGQSSTSAHVTVDQHLGPMTEDQLKSLCYVFIIMTLVGWGPFAFLCLTTLMGGSAGVSMLAASIPPLACKLMVSMYPLAYSIISPRFAHSFRVVLTGADKKQD